MRKVLVLASAMVVLAAGSASAQMMGGGMMGSYQPPQQQAVQQPGYGAYPWGMMNPGMMGYGTYPGMMNPNMMGYGMMGYGAYPGMLGPGMMMGPNMMGYGMMGYAPAPCGGLPGAPGCPGAYGTAGLPAAAEQKFLDETAELRRKVHGLMFEYMEAARDPKADPAKVGTLAREIGDLQRTIQEKWREAAR